MASGTDSQNPARREEMKRFFATLRSCFVESVSPACRTTGWLLRIMLPVSLAVTIAQHYGVIDWLAGYLNPLMELVGLPGRAAVGFLSGAFVMTYAGIAAMLQLSLTMREATIVGIMICLCHALFLECAVNKKVGSSFWRMFVIRLCMAFLAGYLLNAVLPPTMDGVFGQGVAAPAEPSRHWVRDWVFSSARMCALTFLLILALMVLQRTVERYGLMERMARPLRPFMRFCGLPEDAAYMWIVGNILGISYGSAVMVDLETQGKITREEANDVNYHLIMNHSLLEDTAVFASMGIAPLWIVSTRFLFALLVVWSRRLLRSAAVRLQRQGGK